MSLDHAILGFLQYRPSTGYDLKALFDLSVQHFWPADQSQIYRTLGRLAERGWAEMAVVEQQDRPDRKVYRITPGGQEELHRWLLSPVRLKAERSAPLVRVFFAGGLTDEQALAVFRELADHCREGLRHLHALPEQCAPYSAEVDSPREEFFWMLTLEAGIRMTEAYLAWVEDVIARIEQGAVPPEGGRREPCKQ